MNNQVKPSDPDALASEAPTPNYRLLFESAPGLNLILTRELIIVAASDAYLRATMTNRDELLGRCVFDAFPDNPEDPTADGVANLRASLERVVRHGVTDTMAVQKYDIRRPQAEGGAFEERYWSPVNFPVFDDNDAVAYIYHRVEDVTEFIRVKQRGVEQAELAQLLLNRSEQMESEIFLRAQEIQEGNRRLLQTNQELTQLQADLEHRVRKRTEELAAANESLQAEVLERKRNEGLLQSILDNAFDAIISIGERGTIETYNDAAERMFGYTAAEAVGRNVNILMPEPYHTQHDGYLESYMRTGIAKIIGSSREMIGRRKDGSTFPIELSVTECKAQEGELRRFIGAIRDITQRKQAEEHQARLVQVLEATPDFVGLADADHRALFMNRAGRAMMGIDADEDITSSSFDKFHPAASLATIQQVGIPAALAEGTWVGETALLTRDGREIPVSQVIVAHKTATGEVRFLSTIMRELTERVRLEQQLHQAQKMEAFGQLSGGVAHDFNNLLTIINGYCECLQDDEVLSADSREMVQEIHNAGNRAAALTRQLLAFSRQQVLQPKVLSLNDVVAQTGAMLERLIGEDVRLKFHLDADLWQVKVDAGQMEQVLMNLAVNARDAMPRGGELVIETANIELDADDCEEPLDTTPGSYVVMSVRDTGFGMDQETKSRIFEPFFTTKAPGKGTGLGLATVFGIVAQSGGSVSVDSEPGGGTTFRIYLPKVETEQESRLVAAYAV